MRRNALFPWKAGGSGQPLCEDVGSPTWAVVRGQRPPCECRPYEDCCGSRCCVRALSIQRLWYFWFLLMMGVLFCCGAGFFIRRRMYPPPLIEEPAFNVSYTRQPPNPAPGAQQPGLPYYTDPGGPGMNPAGNTVPMAFQVQPNSPQGSMAYPPPPSYCNTPPPPYEQVVKAK
ncbi:vesicular, overexpressed in cancer, prosurvival protein 1 isoform X2 [Meles meles]|uniref:vesicular, overexpressed in cancer, prosurvival protein 1 isoform X2 n=1 Tax=Meles meles TaxID=9662 RepID=UPI001E69AA07|nr:vesicular, overexpressed in cancer, prosurvival protein 1 isoform X2 [Meles meles]